MSKKGRSFRVLLNGKRVLDEFDVAPGETVSVLDKRLTERLNLPQTHRLLLRGRALSNPGETLDGLTGDVLYVISSSEDDVAAVKAAKPDPLVRGFISSTSPYVARPASTSKLRVSPFGFQCVRELPGYTDACRARDLLNKLANDRGFVSVMENRRWTVGALCEMEPEGKVGVDPVCVLGFNVNKGHEIHLRLRTDDKRGFRPMYLLRQVLAHELAHNVHSEHDSQFYELMRQIEREAKANDWTQSSGSAVGGGPEHSGGDVVGRDPLDVSASMSLNIVRQLGSRSREPGVEASRESSGIGQHDQQTSASVLTRRDERRNMHDVDDGETADVGIGEATVVEREPSIGPVPVPVATRSEGAVRNDAPPTNDSRDDAGVRQHGNGAANTTELSEKSGATNVNSIPAPLPHESDASPGGRHEGNVLDALVGMGFGSALARIALRECDGDSERAANWLLSLDLNSAPEEVVGDAGEQAGVHLRRLESAVSALEKEASSRGDLEDALVALHLFVFNISRYPNVQRYRRINASNSGFRRLVGRYSAAAEALQAIGYFLQDGFWVMDGSVDLARVWVAKSLLVRKLMHSH